VLAALACRLWFRAAGAVAQELIPPLGHDLRIVVARGRIVGAAKRIAPSGEWRTNVALGARVVPAEPPPVDIRPLDAPDPGDVYAEAMAALAGEPAQPSAVVAQIS